ncbi:hypothetical protein JB92DRAFT_250045 [Gautieria morchelliformis]|nr:hypothetical protein JB92DRAFT_250045 [Gautieria morchelliformis]
MQRPQPSHRPRSHGFSSNNKRAVVGNTAGTVPPAWRTTVAQPHDRRETRPAVGSKILMSQLPVETVHERDIEELFAETIGPVFNVFIVYNSNGRSKGMAVVNFQRSGDAAEARRKYNGKIIDGRRPLKIELITDPPDAPVKVKSLAERLERPIAKGTTNSNAHNLNPPGPTARVPNVTPQTQRRKFKKGPRRLKKSVEQLDREMETYMAAAPQFSASDIKMAVDNSGTDLA